jgi:transposase-like protein
MPKVPEDRQIEELDSSWLVRRIRCPHCKAVYHQTKAGHNASGSQRYKCRVCNRKYTPYPRQREIGYSPEYKEEVIKFYYEHYISIRELARMVKLSPQTVSNWVHSPDAIRRYGKTQTRGRFRPKKP